MTTTTPAPPASADRVKEMLAAGHTLTHISARTGWPRPQLTALITGWKGWLFDHERDVAYQPGSGPRTTVSAPAAPKPADAPASRPPATKAPSSLSVATVAELITRAADLDDKPVQRALERVTEALARLRAAVADVDARAEEERRRQAALEEVERLEQELAAAKARAKELGGKRTAKPAAAKSGATAKDIRAWAAEHDVECNARGHVPQRVIDAYNAAHGATS